MHTRPSCTSSIPNRPQPNRVLEPPTGTTKEPKRWELVSGELRTPEAKCRKPAKDSTDRQLLPMLPFPNSHMHQFDSRSDWPFLRTMLWQMVRGRTSAEGKEGKQ